MCVLSPYVNYVDLVLTTNYQPFNKCLRIELRICYVHYTFYLAYEGIAALSNLRVINVGFRTMPEHAIKFHTILRTQLHTIFVFTGMKKLRLSE